MGAASGAALTVLMLLAAFPPLELAVFAWCALVPLLLVLREARGKLAWLLIWLAGWAFGIGGFFWARHVTVLGMVLLGLYISVYFLVFCAAARWLSFRKGMPLAFAAALVWTSLEVIRGVFLTGLPMLFLAHTQYEALPVIQVADLTGAAGVTFWIAAVNGILADAICYFRQRAPRRGARRVLIAAVFVLVISAFAQWYGSFRLNTIVTRRGPSIALIQGNIPQDVKNRLTEEDVEDIFRKHLAMTDEAQAGRPPRMVIWPETMTPYGLFDLDYEEAVRRRISGLREEERLEDARYHVQRLRKTARWRRLLYERQQRSALLLGSGSYSPGDKEVLLYNSVRFLPGGGRGPTARYDKIHLVPFGEYVPLKPLIGWIVGPLIPFEQGLTPGAGQPLFEIDGWRFAPTICFEDQFPRLTADFGRGGQKMDFIVNVTNEGWFKDGTELDEHLAIAVFRAVECRAGFVRAANTGISAFISPTGRILSRLIVDGRDREVGGVLRGHATTTDLRSPYLALGELFGWLCVAVWALCSAGLALANIKPPARRPSAAE
ncbi:MAG: apolipoprotein N-acyltransferase [Planctomycetota bacterium]